MLVSHWSVESNASVFLTTRFSEAMREHPGRHPAYALQDAILGYLSDADERLNAPWLWAPFDLIGEGVGGRL